MLWALLLDVPTGMDRIDVPVLLVQGTADWIASGQTVRYLPLVPRSRFRPLLAAGHAPQSDRPEDDRPARGRDRPASGRDRRRRILRGRGHGVPSRHEDSSAFRYAQRKRARDIASVNSASQAGSWAGNVSSTRSSSTAGWPSSPV